MNKYLIFIILIIVFILYLEYYNKNITENFVALSGIESSLTSYDSYGTFNFLFNTNDLPYYDPTYDNLGCDFREPAPKSKTSCGSVLMTAGSVEDFSRDTFIEYEGQKVRRNLVPANYSEEQSFADAKFDRNQLHLAIKKDRPRASAQPPQPHNIYFNKNYLE